MMIDVRNQENNMTIVIKKMETDKEIQEKAYVHWKSWQEAYIGIVPKAFLDDLTLEKCEYLALQRTDNILVAKKENRVIGFISYGPYRDSDLENNGEIYAVYILSEYYGMGIGYQLMQEACWLLKAYSRIIVWVFKENIKAIRFYQKCGFNIDGEEKRIILGKSVTAIRMSLNSET